MSHFLATDHDIDGDRVYGIYDTFEAARSDIEARTTEKARIEAEARANRKPGQIGDPGPYVPMGEYGVERAEIEEWQGRKHVATWERRWDSPLAWKCTWPATPARESSQPEGNPDAV